MKKNYKQSESINKKQSTKTSDPYLSIIIPTKNSARIIQALLLSLTKSHFQNFETIINNDPSSSDNMGEIVDSFQDKLQIVYLTKNRSMAQGRLSGAKAAAGQVLIHLDSDMQVSDRLLGECVSLIEAGNDALVIPEYSIAGSFWGKVKALEKSIYQDVQQLQSLRVVKKEIYFALGGHSAEMVFSEDKDLDLRVRQAGYVVGHTQNNLIHNEGSPTLAGILKKKIGYSKTAGQFSIKHPEAYSWQANPLNRYLAFIKNFRYFFAHPIIYPALYFLKTMEYVFSFLGIIKNGSAKTLPSHVAKVGSQPIQNQELVSVIVPTKNSGQYLERCLKSIRAQTYKHIELIVVDNFSTDNTLTIAKKYADFVYQKGPERSAQVNHGVTKCSGQYIYKVDSDFSLDKKVIEECVTKIKTGFDAVVVHNTPDQSISWIAKIRKFEVDMYKYDLRHSSARFIKASVFNKIGGFNPLITAGDDYDLQNRLNRQGYKTGFIDAEATHHGEPKKLLPHLKKYFMYGKDFTHYHEQNAEESTKQLFNIFRGVYFKNWRKFVRHPLLAVAFVFYIMARYMAGGSGFLIAKLTTHRQVGQ